MPHTTSILVVHTNGAISYVTRARAQAAAERNPPVAYWSDRSQTKLVMLKSTPEQADPNYEYGGKKSYDGRASKPSYCDRQTRTVVHRPIEHQDRSGIPVREAGGQKVLQLKPLADRKSSGRHVTRQDRLWHPGRPRGKDHTAEEVAQLRAERN